MSKKKQEKVYIVRKYILATSAREAIKKDKTWEVDDCWAEDKSLSNFIENLTPKKDQPDVGFKTK